MSVFTTTFSTVYVFIKYLTHTNLAREQDKTYQFLKIPPPEGSREHILWKKENEPEPVAEPEATEENAADEEGEINEESPGNLVDIIPGPLL